MKIYTLTCTNTQQSFSPMEVLTFVSHEEAHKKMIEKLHNHLTECNYEISIEKLDSKDGYESDGIGVGYDYAKDYDGMYICEIFTTEISLREVIIGSILSYIRETYKTPARFDNVLYKLANEYKDEDLNSIKDMGDFVQEHIIGEALYQNALAELGGKNTDSAYGKILEYLNESDQFINVRCTMFNYWDLPIEEEKLEKWQKWFIGMLTICDGNQTMINLVRDDIDNEQPDGDKIFLIEREKDFVNKHKNMLCKNHRELCSKLTDEQYFDIMTNILTKKFKFYQNGGATTYQKMENLYEEMYYTIFKIIKAYGIDGLLNEYESLIKLENSDKYGWNVVFVENHYEVAQMIDTLKNTYDNFF